MSSKVTKLATSNEPAAVLSMVERVATDPNASIETLEKMLDMQERIMDRQARQAFSASMADMQSSLPRVIKTASSHTSKYAKLEDINDQIRPTLREHGFAVTYSIDQTSGIKVTTKLSHRDGHFEETSIVLPADTSGSKNGVQAVGSTISYGKRYGICAILNISTGDDTDGHVEGLDSPWLVAIKQAKSLSELQKVFAKAWAEVKSDAKLAKVIAAAKDARKKELSK